MYKTYNKLCKYQYKITKYTYLYNINQIFTKNKSLI